ncbi:MAG: hypothetical protein AAF483_03505 [Planctomycetota bacterium]
MSQNTPQKWFNLEERFFKNMDAELLDNLRGNMEKAETAERLMEVTGIQNAELAAAIVELKVTVETLAAFRLSPLVAVAWADDRVEENERYSILKAAEASGISAEDPSMALLEAWTKHRPQTELLEAWCEYAQALGESLGAEQRQVLKSEMLGQIQKVAEANGGVLGFGSVCNSEKELIAKVSEALG